MMLVDKFDSMLSLFSNVKACFSTRIAESIIYEHYNMEPYDYYGVRVGHKPSASGVGMTRDSFILVFVSPEAAATYLESQRVSLLGLDGSRGRPWMQELDMDKLGRIMTANSFENFQNFITEVSVYDNFFMSGSRARFQEDYEAIRQAAGGIGIYSSNSQWSFNLVIKRGATVFRSWVNVSPSSAGLTREMCIGLAALKAAEQAKVFFVDAFPSNAEVLTNGIPLTPSDLRILEILVKQQHPVDPDYQTAALQHMFQNRLKCAGCQVAFPDTVKPRVCGNCKKVYYCSKECQKTHWRGAHKHECMKS